MDNNHNQEEETCKEVLLCVDDISDLFTQEFERYAKLSEDVYALPCFSSSYDGLLSPKFDVEEDIIL